MAETSLQKRQARVYLKIAHRQLGMAEGPCWKKASTKASYFTATTHSRPPALPGSQTSPKKSPFATGSSSNNSDASIRLFPSPQSSPAFWPSYTPNERDRCTPISSMGR